MSFVNKTNSQFIQPRIDNRKGVVCSGQSGGGYGSTADSLAASATGGLGKGVPSASTHYNNCDKQSGGGHNYDADVEGFSYGYTKEGAAVAGQLRGSYAPISVNKKTNMCGGKKRRRKSKKKRNVEEKIKLENLVERNELKEEEKEAEKDVKQKEVVPVVDLENYEEDNEVVCINNLVAIFLILQAILHLVHQDYLGQLDQEVLLVK